MNRLTLNNIGQIQQQLDTNGLDYAGPVQERIQCAQPSSRSWQGGLRFAGGHYAI